MPLIVSKAQKFEAGQPKFRTFHQPIAEVIDCFLQLSNHITFQISAYRPVEMWTRFRIARRDVVA